MSAAAIGTRAPTRRLLGWLLWIALGTALAIAIRNLPWKAVIEQLARVQLPWIAAALAANFAILPLWASEWRLLVPAAFRVSFVRMFEVVAISASVLNAVPFFAGEASAVALLIGRVGLSRSAALSVLALDQLYVAFAKLSTLAAAAVLVDLPAWLRAGVLSLSAGFAALSVALLVLAHFWERVQARLADGSGRLRAVAARVVRWGDHLDTLRSPARAGAVAVFAILKKGAEVAAVLAIQHAFGIDASLPIAVLVVAALAITTLLPVAPANLGVYEATVFAIYRFAGMPSEIAAGLAIVQHASFLLPSLLTGYLAATAAQVTSARRPRPAA